MSSLTDIPEGKLIDRSMWLFVNEDVMRLFVSLSLVGIGQVMMNSAFGDLQADLTPKDQRGKVNGFINSANQVLMALGSLTGDILYEHVSPQLPFFLAIILVVPSLIIALMLVHEPEKREE